MEADEMNELAQLVNKKDDSETTKRDQLYSKNMVATMMAIMQSAVNGNNDVEVHLMFDEMVEGLESYGYEVELQDDGQYKVSW